MKIAIIHFPGSNCELEALRQVRKAGMEAEIIRWNEDYSKLQAFDGFILPGGFSYEDRGRAGMIASKDPIMESIKKEADKGKPVLGICNGAQMLIESHMVPGIEEDKLDMALAWNEWIQDNDVKGVGFVNDWIYIKNVAARKRSVFNNFSKDILIRCPVANGEGRYTTQTSNLINKLIENEQIVFKFADKNGETIREFPINPNNAVENIAAICNPEGNVMSLMPHPERTDMGQPIFHSMKEYLENDISHFILKDREAKSPLPTADIEKTAEIEIFIKLIITDNEERTLEAALHRLGLSNVKLEKENYYGIEVEDKSINLKELAEQILNSDEIVNLNKEIPRIKIGNTHYQYEKDTGLTEVEQKEIADKTQAIKTLDRDNYSGKLILNKLKEHFQISGIKSIEKGWYWEISGEENTEKVLDTHVLHNPHSMLIQKL